VSGFPSANEDYAALGVLVSFDAGDLTLRRVVAQMFPGCDSCLLLSSHSSCERLSPERAGQQQNESQRAKAFLNHHLKFSLPGNLAWRFFLIKFVSIGNAGFGDEKPHRDRQFRFD
jgi:hypothetical protein